ncbi:MAG TPA: AtpZ/AtpI family protein [Dongiaceae bacterium]|jgi:ATP synthase protein I
MSEGDPPKRSNDFDERLRQLRERAPREDKAVQGPDSQSRTAIGFAFRIGVELLAALLVGGGIGWLLDHWFGTLPLFLLIFFFLGAGAGMLNVFRAAKELNRGD